MAEDIFKLAKRQGSDIPELVWHYLSDADIRIKDADYARHQILAVKDFIGLNEASSQR